jgi:hypothetical protein
MLSSGERFVGTFKQLYVQFRVAQPIRTSWRRKVSIPISRTKSNTTRLELPLRDSQLIAKKLDEKSNVQMLHIPNSDKPVAFYNLDVRGTSRALAVLCHQKPPF